MDVTSAKKIVIKVGSSTLTYGCGRMNFRRFDHIARVLSDLKNDGRQVILVSSGAGAAGRAKLLLSKRPDTPAKQQAVAAVGQCELMHIYERSFEDYSQTVAQILLTADIIHNPHGLDNVKNTFDTLLQMGIIPIVNENDSVAYDEIVVGDNDSLSAIVATIVEADLLILLSDIDGLYDSDPHKNRDAKLIPVVHEITADIIKGAEGAGSDFGTGGMKTKLHAAQVCKDAGIPMIIANGEEIERIYDIFDGKPVGTLFLP